MPALPDVAEIRKAIDVYLATAYGAQRPGRVKTIADALATCETHLLECPSFVKDASANPSRYNLRLGNPTYPHMKLAVEQTPDGHGWLYRVDTHDRHACPPETSKEYGLFCQLMSNNQKLAEQIEAAWEQQGVPTFKSFLREDLKRRMASMQR